MKRTILALCSCMVLVAFIASGCRERVEQGVVYNKKFAEAHTEVTSIVQAVPAGGQVRTVIIPVTRYYPDEWMVYVRDERGYEDRYTVSEETYANVEVGRCYCFSKSESGWNAILVQ